MARRKSSKRGKNTRTLTSSKVTIPMVALSPELIRAHVMATIAGQLAASQMVSHAQTGFDYNEDVLFDWAITRAGGLLKSAEAICGKES